MVGIRCCAGWTATWPMTSNVAVEMDAAGNRKPSKKKSIERIDGIVATIMALGRAMLTPQFQSTGIGKFCVDNFTADCNTSQPVSVALVRVAGARSADRSTLRW